MRESIGLLGMSAVMEAMAVKKGKTGQKVRRGLEEKRQEDEREFGVDGAKAAGERGSQ